MEIINLNNSRYVVKYKRAFDSSLPEFWHKDKHKADVILRQNNTYYLCEEILDVKYEDILDDDNSGQQKHIHGTGTSGSANGQTSGSANLS